MKVRFPFARRTARNSQLEEILRQLEMNASNNYKDAAQANLKEFEAALRALEAAGQLGEKEREYYEEKLSALKDRLQKFTHADQKATWDS